MAISSTPQDHPYQVLVNGKAITLYQANVYDPCCGIPSYGGPYWFGSFDVSGEATIEVTTSKSLDKLEIVPASNGIVPNVSGNKITMKVTKPMKIVVEPDGKNGPLLIFINPPEVNVPKQGDPNVVFYGAGEHEAGKIELTDNQTLYLAPGAVVKGGILAKGKNITIRGRGVIDGLSYPRFRGPSPSIVTLEDCKNVKVEGIVVKDGWGWSFAPHGCNDVVIDNVKLVCSRVENGDGFDIVNSQNVKIVNSFVRSDDDCIAPKGMNRANGQATENIHVENCVLWTDKAHVWRIGCESRADAFRNFVFKNIDVLHFPDLWTPDEVPFCISLEPAEELHIDNLLFEDIRIRTNGQKGLIDVRPKVTQWADAASPGFINNVTFRNISYTGTQGSKPGAIRISGPDPSHVVTHISFENVTYNNELITASSPNVSILGYTECISFKGKPIPPFVRGKGMTNIEFKKAPKNRHIVIVEANQARGMIYAIDGETGKYKDDIKQIQQVFANVLNVKMSVTDKDNGLILSIGDNPEALAQGLDGSKLPEGMFEIKTRENEVFIVGNGIGLAKGIDAFLEYFLGYKDGQAIVTKTDLVIPATWMISK